MLDARVLDRQTDLATAQNDLVRARVRLTTLERREAARSHTLSDNLVATYKAGRPDLVTIVLGVNNFTDLFERVKFVRRASSNARLLDRTRTARRRDHARGQGPGAAAHALQPSSRGRRSTTATAPTSCATRCSTARPSSWRGRDGVATRLAAVRGRIARLQRRPRPPRARRAAAATATRRGAGADDGGSGGDVVARVVAAANEIATTPYVWGGGHGGASGGYDCSGSISYALAAAGLLSSPLDSTGFMTWGEAGPGTRITVYANAGHAFMVVDGRRYDTSALSGGGTRWTSEMRSSAGFVARHPPGL